MQNIEDKLIKWKKEINESETNISRLEGQYDEIIRRAQKEVECSTLNELNKKLTISQNNIEKLTTKLEQLVQEYEEKYAGDDDEY